MQILKVIYAHCKEPGNHWTLLIDTRLKDITKCATHYRHVGTCPS